MNADRPNQRTWKTTILLLFGLCITAAFPGVTQAQTPPDIDIWYGLNQDFGTLGNPQRFIDILGNVSDADGVALLSYSLNGGTDSTLSVGPDGRRLVSTGDFCIDINTEDLIDGTNQVVITATDNSTNVSTETVTVEYDAGNVWTLPYSIDWSSATNISDVSQIVDGEWELETDAVRTTTTGYDRLIGIGDTTWHDYEVTVPITIHSMDPNGGIGVLIRWEGHTDEPASAAGEQPKSGWLPLGAILRYKVGSLDIYANGSSAASTARTLTMDTTYIFKARVETVPGVGGQYSLKVWEEGDSEPTAWDVTAQEEFSDPQNGSLLLFAHLGDVSYGDVDIDPLFINDIEVAAGETSAEVTWTTTAPATSSVAYGPTDAYEDGSVSDGTMVTDHSITLPSLSPNTTYHCQITSVDGGSESHSSVDFTFATSGSSGIESDDFDAASLNTSIWTFIDPLVDATLTMTGTGTPDAWAEIAVPGGTEHKINPSAADVPRLMQSAGDANFEVEVKFESLLESRYQTEGILVEEDSDNFIRFEFYHNGTSTFYYAATYQGATKVTQHSGTIPDGTPQYMRVLRESDQWTQSFFNGTSWEIAGSFEHDMTVTGIGPYFGNSEGTSSTPAYTGQIDYFFNTDSPIVPEDTEGNVAPELAAIGDQYLDEGSTLAVPISATDDDGDDITLTDTDLPPFATLTDYGDGTGQLDIEPNPGDAGDYVVTITATDPGALFDDETFTIHVREITPPTVLVTAPASGETHTTLPELTIVFADNIGLDRGYFQIDACTGPWTELWSYNSESSDTTIEWTPTVPEGTYTIYFRVTDDAGNVNADSCAYSWIFTYELSDAPVITSTPVINATVGQPYTYDVEATGDPTPEYSLTTWPAGMVIDNITGLIEWTPATAGDHDVTVEAGNTAGTDIQDFTISVVDPPDCPSDLTHYWKLDEAAGPPYVDFYGSADGTCSDCPTPAVGIVGGAQQFDGSNDEVSVADDGSWDWGATESFSIACWMNSSAGFSELKALVGRNDGGSGLRWWLGCDADGSVRFQLRDVDGNGPYLNGASDPLNDGAWHFIVGVKDESVDRVRVYVDGTLADSADHNYTAGFTGSVDLTIGYLDLSGHLRYDGVIDEVATFDKALTDTEIQTFYTRGLASLGYCDQGDVAPVIISSPILDATAGLPYTYDVNASGYPAPDFALLTAPTGMTIDPVSGLIEWTPSPGDEGPHAVEVEASNTEGTDTQDYTLTVVGPTPPEIEIWYGLDQQFGHIGNPQSAIDILGNVSDPDGVTLLVYSLNGAPDSVLSIGPDGNRLVSEGDFNVEIDIPDLIDGTNEVVITATDGLANVSVETVTVEYTAGNEWPLPYATDWGAVTNIQEAAQVVDGQWELGSVRTAVTGYDRLIAIGDAAWEDYEVTVPMTIHSWNSGKVGVLLRWQGHTDDPVSGRQPKTGWFPLGAILRCKPDGMDIYGNGGAILDDNSRVLNTGTAYLLKARVESIPGEGALYSLKVWEETEPEPGEWDVSGQATVSDPTNGSMMLFAHRGDVTFGDVEITELMISDIEVVASETEAIVTWTTSEAGNSSVAYGLTDAYELGSVSESDLVISHSITLTGLTDNTLYHFQVTSVVGGTEYVSLDMTLQTPLSSGIVSDDFNSASLNGSIWSFIQPLGDATLDMVGTQTEDAWASIGLPSGTAHRVWSGGNDSPRLMQASNNADFEIEAKFESDINAQFQLQGIFVEQDSDNLIRFEFYSDGTNTYIFASSYVGLTGTTRVNDIITGGVPMYMRVKREGDLWTLSHSLDGSVWTTAVSFTHSMTVTAVGPYAGNSGDTPPAHTGLIDYFFNTASPIVPEDVAPPVITSIAITDGVIEQPYVYDVEALGSPLPTYSLTTSPAGMTVDPNTGLIEWTPDALGGFSVAVEALNSLGADTQGFVITVVGVPPVITSTPPTTGEVYELYSYDVEADGAPAPTFALTTFPTGMTIDPATGLIQWTPDDIGDYEVTVEASNSEGMAPQSFTVSVTGSEPVFTSTPVTDVVAEQLYSYDADADGAPFPKYTLTVFPDGMTVDSVTGLIQWTPAVVGDYDVTMEANNSVGTATQVFTINVTGIPPEITSTPDTETNVGQPYTYDVEANGAPSPVYALITAPAGMTIDPVTGLVQWTPVAKEDFDVTIEAGNSEGTDTQSYTLSVVGVAPTITSTPVRNATMGELYMYDVDASGDPPLVFELSSTAPEGMTVDAGTGVIQWIPADTGHFLVIVRAVNDIGSDRQVYILGVGGIPATITSTPVTATTVDLLYTYDVNAAGYPDPIITMTTYPDGMIINEITGEIQWTPNAVGDYPVTVEANNDAGMDTQSFTITVGGSLPAIVSTAPEVAIIDQPYVYVSIVEEATGNPTPVYALVTYPTGMSIDINSGVIDWTPDAIGGYDVVVEAVNEAGADSQSFTINVTETTVPVVQVTAPVSGATCYNCFPELTIAFSDNIGLDRGYYQIDDCGGAWTELWPYNAGLPDTTVLWTVPEIPNGEHTIYLKIVDDAGNANEDTCSYSWTFTRAISCCIGLRGNVDDDPEGIIDQADLVALIDYLFISFTPPVCMEAVNVDGSPDGIIDLGDVTVLVSYLYISFDPPAECPTFVPPVQ